MEVILGKCSWLNYQAMAFLNEHISIQVLAGQCYTQWNYTLYKSISSVLFANLCRSRRLQCKTGFAVFWNSCRGLPPTVGTVWLLFCYALRDMKQISVRTIDLVADSSEELQENSTSSLSQETFYSIVSSFTKMHLLKPSRHAMLLTCPSANFPPSQNLYELAQKYLC